MQIALSLFALALAYELINKMIRELKDTEEGP